MSETLLVVREIKVWEKTFRDVILCLYFRSNGCPHTLGLKIAEFLKDIEIVRKLDVKSDKPKLAHSGGCLAAQLVAEFKGNPGEVYLLSLKSKMSEFTHCYLIDISWDGSDYEQMKVSYKLYGKNHFTGSIQEFLNFCNK